jgi:hypothetical protein
VVTLNCPLEKREIKRGENIKFLSEVRVCDDVGLYYIVSGQAPLEEFL